MRAHLVRSAVVLAAVLALPWSVAAQSLRVLPASLKVVATEGTTPPPQTVVVRIKGNSSATFSVRPPSVAWLSVSPTSGSQETTLTVSLASNKPAGSYTGTFDVVLSNGAAKTVSVQLTVEPASTPPPPPPPTSSPSGVGPQATITCPSGSADIWPGQSIQGIVDTFPANSTFCLRAGVHYLRSSVTPKSGDTFVGEYGAVLDGTGWSTSDTTQAAFRAHNQDIDYVKIRNLVIRNMPQRGVNAFYYMSNNWTIEFTEIKNTVDAVLFPASSVLRNNYLHHNSGGGYLGTYASNSIIENNEIAYNGKEQKIGESVNVTFRNNFVHHNAGDGIWFDSNNSGILIEGNRVEDNGFSGIFFEIGTGATIRNNIVRRSADTAIFISTSKNSQIYGNTLENNFRGITYFVNCASVGSGTISFDLANNAAYDNVLNIGSQSGVLASAVSYINCSSTQAAAYLNGSKNLKFYRNTYDVPSPSAQYWLWNGMKYWNEWQGAGHDLDGTVK